MGSVNSAGEMQSAFVYGPFGEVLEELGDTEKHLRRFNGKDADPVSRLNYYGYRYYDPLSLQWTQADPLFRIVPDLAYDQPRMMSLYTFSLNNPVRYVDPDGLFVGPPAACALNPACATAVGTGVSIAGQAASAAAGFIVGAGISIIGDWLGDSPTPKTFDIPDTPGESSPRKPRIRSKPFEAPVTPQAKPKTKTKPKSRNGRPPPRSG